MQDLDHVKQRLSDGPDYDAVRDV